MMMMMMKSTTSTALVVVLMAVVHTVFFFFDVQCIDVVSAFAPPRPVLRLATTVTAAAAGKVSTRSSTTIHSESSSSEEINESDHRRRHHHHRGVGDIDDDSSSSAFGGGVSADRRSFINKGLMAVTTAAAAASASVFVPTMTRPAYASGGATAGGAYLLSAKQRYNERVKTSVKGLLQVEESLKNGDSKTAKAYFDSEDAGSWKDLTAAGYLLSNAFRRTASKAPDSLPSVQKYKAFAASVESLQKTLKKKGAQAAADQFGSVETALNTWLEEIELPNAREL